MDLASGLKKLIASRDNFRCRRCGIELKQDAFERNIDHIIPRDLIAISELWNLELLCINCNEQKGSKLSSDFQERCTRALKKSFSLKKEELKNQNYIGLALKAVFVQHHNYYQTELKEHYKDDYINKKKYGSNYRVLIDLVRNLALQQEFKVSNVKKKKKSTEKLSQQLKKEANEAIKSLKNIFRPIEEKKEEKAIKAEQDLLLQYDRKFSQFLLSSAQNKHYSTIMNFMAWSEQLTPRKDNEILSADELLNSYLRMFEYLNNC
jgi:hypothetical protein